MGWAIMFAGATAFNLCIGGSIMIAPSWTFHLAYAGAGAPETLRFWADFGFAVALIGVGYGIVARDVTRNRGLVWIGIFAKLFDVVVLGTRWLDGVAHTAALVPGAIDGAFILLFIAFLRARPARP
jgi:hypothetical protein